LDARPYCGGEVDFRLYQITHLNHYDALSLASGASMRRREVLSVIGGAAMAWPLRARAQQGERMRRVGVLMNGNASDQEQQGLLAMLTQTLAKLGWMDGRNVRIEIRWAEGILSDTRKHAEEFAASKPDIILATGTVAMGPLLQATQTVPIVFNNVADPVGAGIVDSLARPGGNATGFIQFEYTLSGKWPELIKKVAPDVSRVAVLRDAAQPSGIGQFAVIQSVTPLLGMEVSAINVRDAGEIERAGRKIRSHFKRQPDLDGKRAGVGASRADHQARGAAPVARGVLPPQLRRHRRFDVLWLDVIEQFRGAAGYIDRILKGEKPADLPVQAPTKYELVINLKTAKALGLTVPQSLLSTADEVI
jgi:putative ABC transport system substrate-binding protein